MYTIYLNIIYIATIMVFVIDLSGFNETYKKCVAYMLKTRAEHIKNLCSLCFTWWTCNIYLLYINSFTLCNIFYITIVSFLTPVIGDLMLAIKDTLIKIINYIQ